MKEYFNIGTEKIMKYNEDVAKILLKKKPPVIREVTASDKESKERASKLLEELREANDEIARLSDKGLAKKLKELEKENEELKKQIADLTDGE